MRGFMLDSARTLESRAYYEQFIQQMAGWGCDTLLWHFSDDQGCSLRFDSLPEAASPNAYANQEMRDLLKLAADHGVQVIPELETLGHTRFITRARPDLAELAENDEEFTSLCPVHPRVREVIGTLLDEVCEVFDAPLVHVGLDEVNFGDHPLTQAALRDRSHGDLFADHVRFLHGRLAKHGRRLMMWGDHLLKDSDLAGQVPKDILVANWQYARRVPDETTRTLQDQGFEVVSCPAMISHDQPLFPGEAFALANLRSTADHVARHHTAGTITTIWTPQRFLHGAIWPGVHLAAVMMERGAQVDLHAVMQEFGSAYYGLSKTDDWASAMVNLLTNAPMRRPWVAALKLELDERLEDVDLPAEAESWRDVAEVLRASRAAVRQHERSYDALVLMAHVLAHTFDRAARACSDDLDEATLRQSEDLGQQLEATWDAERFADDPRKRRPVFPFDADNHLLVTFDRGTAAVRSRLRTSSLTHG